MSKMITSASEIPDSFSYVTATDTYLSRWGESVGKDNRVIFPCANEDEEGLVTARLGQRTDMKRVYICSRKPKIKKGVTYSLMDKESAFYRK